MREIKFRGKRLDNGEWVYGNYIKVTPYKCSDGHRICTQDTWDMFSVEGKTVGQFTGLKDKNGKEIYEGDLTWDSPNEVVGKIIFDEGKFLYEWENISEDLFEVCDVIEITGNIFEDNTELLEVD